jgi:energy-coupling factor transport system ATP-binding protein
MALREVELMVRPTEVVALMGRNGAGKSTLLASVAGQLQPSRGQVRLGDLDPARSAPAQIVRRAGLVPQDPSLILYADTVADELATADRDFGLPAGSTASVLDRVAPGMDRDQHPRDLSEGQRVSLAIAVVLASTPPLVLLDEPTRGLDYAAKHVLAGILRGLAEDGHAVLVATHDVEFVAQVADEVVVLADGEVVSSGPTHQVIAESPAFAPQVSKVFGADWLTVDEVAAALGEGDR